MTDDNLAIEEAERSANYEAIKSTVKGEVGNEIAAEASILNVLFMLASMVGRHRCCDVVTRGTTSESAFRSGAVV